MSERLTGQIAIIGMGCRFPGASDLSTYWENILAGKDCTREVPPSRWDAGTFHDPSSSRNDRVACQRGGYLDEPVLFDVARHGIMPRTVEGGEPEQFVLLDAAVAAVEDAGVDLARLAGTRTEVVIGRGNYFNRGNLTRLQHGRIVAQTMAILERLHPGWSPADLDAVHCELKDGLPPFEAGTIPGQLTNATAGRIADRLNLSGAAYVVDAASASSLVALDLGVRSLVERRADLAIVGGVYLEADVDFPLVFQRLGALSRSEVCRPYSIEADGLLAGEGAGVVVLKRRSDAERDGDRIYAVVRAVGLASDGRARGLSAPSARGHARAMRRAYRRAKVDPRSVMLIEGHGLGVPAADRAELRALRAVFPSPERGQRTLGAVSSMIGHAMPAAGVAGLIKAALAIYHRVLPPSLHGEKPHPLLSANAGFRLSASPKPWINPDPETPRRAGVNAFGFGGINAHALLEEHAASSLSGAPGGLRVWDSEAVLLTAEDRGGLVERVRWVIDRLGRHSHRSLKDVAYTINCSEPSAECGARVGVVAANVSELVERLGMVAQKLADPRCSQVRDGRGIYFWDQPLLRGEPNGLAFLFPGEGSQYRGMLGDLCLHFPEVVERFDIADRIALELGETVPPSEHLFGDLAGHEDGLWTTATAVNVVLSSQWALYQLVTQLGLVPDAVAGHSSGELLALAAAGMFDTDRALELQLGRLGSIFRGLESSGELPAARLVAVAGGRERIEAICRELSAQQVLIAMDNCPHQVVLAGPPEQISRVTDRLSEQGILWEALPFERAYHTESFSSVMGPVEAFFRGLALKAPRMPIYSCASKGRMPCDTEEIRELAIAQWTRTVAFRETIEAMHADGMRVFVDIGARGNLAGFVDDTLRGKAAFVIAANLPRRSGLTQLNHLVAATFAHGAAVRAEHLYQRRRPEVIDWDAAERGPSAMVEIKIGFPVMGLSSALVERLTATDGRENLETQTMERARPVVRLSEEIERLGDHEEIDETRYHRSGIRDSSGSSGRSAFLEPAAMPVRGQAVMEHGNWMGADAEAVRGGLSLDDAEARTLEGPISDADCHVIQSQDAGVLAFQETMRAFLMTQHSVMKAYVADGPSLGEDVLAAAGSTDDNNGRSCSEPGPWAGKIEWIREAEAVETVFILDVNQDPVAEHHTLGGRKVSAIDPTLKGLPVVPFAMMAEMVAEVAALIVTPGLVLTTLADVKAHKWVRYEDTPVTLLLHGRRVEADGAQRAWVGIYNLGTDGNGDASRPVFEAVASFDNEPPVPPAAAEWHLEDSRASRFTAHSMYDEQWLFHGPPLQAVCEMGRVSAGGIDGRLQVMPLEPLVASGAKVRMHTDPIILDSFTHLLGCWGLDWMSDRGDVMFPLSMERFEILGERPDVGTELECRIHIPEHDRHRVRVCAEIVRPDGSVWLRLVDWQDWRFHWPGRYRDVFRQPRDHFVGEELSLEDPGRGGVTSRACAVWLEPPGDMGRPVWRDVLEYTQLGPEERAEHLASGGPERMRAQRLWGRIAAKEAARRIWQANEAEPTYPADLAIAHDEHGRPWLMRIDDPEHSVLPAISIAHTEGVAVALAAEYRDADVGIDVERIEERPEGFELSAFTQEELTLLESSAIHGPARTEWVTRFWCAKEAAAKSTGLGLGGRASAATLCGVNFGTGVVRVRLDRDHHPSGVNLASHTSIRVFTARRGEYAWAWTLGEETANDRG